MGRGTRRTPTPDPAAPASRRSLVQQPSSPPSKMDRQATQGSAAEPSPACQAGEDLVQCALCTDDVRRTPEENNRHIRTDHLMKTNIGTAEEPVIRFRGPNGFFVCECGQYATRDAAALPEHINSTCVCKGPRYPSGKQPPQRSAQQPGCSSASTALLDQKPPALPTPRRDAPLTTTQQPQELLRPPNPGPSHSNHAANHPGHRRTSSEQSQGSQERSSGKGQGAGGTTRVPSDSCGQHVSALTNNGGQQPSHSHLAQQSQAGPSYRPSSAPRQSSPSATTSHQAQRLQSTSQQQSRPPDAARHEPALHGWPHHPSLSTSARDTTGSAPDLQPAAPSLQRSVSASSSHSHDNRPPPATSNNNHARPDPDFSRSLDPLFHYGQASRADAPPASLANAIAPRPSNQPHVPSAQAAAQFSNSGFSGFARTTSFVQPQQAASRPPRPVDQRHQLPPSDLQQPFSASQQQGFVPGSHPNASAGPSQPPRPDGGVEFRSKLLNIIQNARRAAGGTFTKSSLIALGVGNTPWMGQDEQNCEGCKAIRKEEANMNEGQRAEVWRLHLGYAHWPMCRIHLAVENVQQPIGLFTAGRASSGHWICPLCNVLVGHDARQLPVHLQNQCQLFQNAVLTTGQFQGNQLGAQQSSATPTQRQESSRTVSNTASRPPPTTSNSSATVSVAAHGHQKPAIQPPARPPATLAPEAPDTFPSRSTSHPKPAPPNPSAAFPPSAPIVAPQPAPAPLPTVARPAGPILLNPSPTDYRKATAATYLYFAKLFKPILVTGKSIDRSLLFDIPGKIAAIRESQLALERQTDAALKQLEGRGQAAGLRAALEKVKEGCVMDVDVALVGDKEERFRLKHLVTLLLEYPGHLQETSQYVMQWFPRPPPSVQPSANQQLAWALVVGVFHFAKAYRGPPSRLSEALLNARIRIPRVGKKPYILSPVKWEKVGKELLQWSEGVFQLWGRYDEIWVVKNVSDIRPTESLQSLANNLSTLTVKVSQAKMRAHALSKNVPPPPPQAPAFAQPPSQPTLLAREPPKEPESPRPQATSQPPLAQAFASNAQRGIAPPAPYTAHLPSLQPAPRSSTALTPGTQSVPSATPFAVRPSQFTANSAQHHSMLPVASATSPAPAVDEARRNSDPHARRDLTHSALPAPSLATDLTPALSSGHSSNATRPAAAGETNASSQSTAPHPSTDSTPSASTVKPPEKPQPLQDPIEKPVYFGTRQPRLYSMMPRPVSQHDTDMPSRPQQPAPDLPALNTTASVVNSGGQNGQPLPSSTTLQASTSAPAARRPPAVAAGGLAGNQAATTSQASSQPSIWIASGPSTRPPSVLPERNPPVVDPQAHKPGNSNLARYEARPTGKVSTSSSVIMGLARAVDAQVPAARPSAPSQTSSLPTIRPSPAPPPFRQVPELPLHPRQVPAATTPGEVSKCAAIRPGTSNEGSALPLPAGTSAPSVTSTPAIYMPTPAGVADGLSRPVLPTSQLPSRPAHASTQVRPHASSNKQRADEPIDPSLKPVNPVNPLNRRTTLPTPPKSPPSTSRYSEATGTVASDPTPSLPTSSVPPTAPTTVATAQSVVDCSVSPPRRVKAESVDSSAIPDSPPPRQPHRRLPTPQVLRQSPRTSVKRNPDARPTEAGPTLSRHSSLRAAASTESHTSDTAQPAPKKFRHWRGDASTPASASRVASPSTTSAGKQPREAVAALAKKRKASSIQPKSPVEKKWKPTIVDKSQELDDDDDGDLLIL